MKGSDMTDEDDERRPLGLVLLTGLYLFFFIVTVSTYGSPFPFLGRIYIGTAAKALVFVDSIICLYLFLGIMKRQTMTWYLLIGYNLFEVVNTIVNLNFITPAELERIIGERIDQEALMVNNIASALAILLLTQYIYRHRHYFTNRRKYLF
ncbi:hypothetical protein [Geobacter sp.]|uniref:hypothetical protein n=1 Tax=Geobacter sp. TaxID=46610 RepID=UPI001AC73D16|nr:hypothetical protein [Geobacter sp.]CAG0993645.1 hypothetical protein GEOBC_02511 [Geobacteraceae bacterium]